MKWVLSFCSGQKIGAYLSDISGAFDKVYKEYLLGKLQSMGVAEVYMNFLHEYLAPRRARVAVEGTLSEPIQIMNSVFQGTVLGPPLWNAFFADVAVPARSCNGKEAMFADDLSVFHEFHRNAEHEFVMDTLRSCRDAVHAWGSINRVEFDPSKEHLILLHPQHGHGEDFLLLGCLMDAKLTMRAAVERILSQIRPKIKALLRTKSHYDVKDMIAQFKTHIWGLMEGHNGAIFHASRSILQQLDLCQQHYLREIGLTESEAFLHYNFAPPVLRRNIGILGLLHKRVLGKCHPMYEELLPRLPQRPFPERHDKQLSGRVLEVNSQIGLYRRSIFAMTSVYNCLPHYVVDYKCVSSFQKALTDIARTRCANLAPRWQYTFEHVCIL